MEVHWEVSNWQKSWHLRVPPVYPNEGQLVSPKDVPSQVSGSSMIPFPQTLPPLHPEVTSVHSVEQERTPSSNPSVLQVFPPRLLVSHASPSLIRPSPQLPEGRSPSSEMCSTKWHEVRSKRKSGRKRGSDFLQRSQNIMMADPSWLVRFRPEIRCAKDFKICFGPSSILKVISVRIPRCVSSIH